MAAKHITALHASPIKLKMEKVFFPCFLVTKKRYVGYAYESPDQKEPIFDAKGTRLLTRIPVCCHPHVFFLWDCKGIPCLFTKPAERFSHRDSQNVPSATCGNDAQIAPPPLCTVCRRGVRAARPVQRHDDGDGEVPAPAVRHGGRRCGAAVFPATVQQDPAWRGPRPGPDLPEGGTPPLKAHRADDTPLVSTAHFWDAHWRCLLKHCDSGKPFR